MGLFGKLFRRRPLVEYPVQQDFSHLSTDIHSHLIPGIDDGVQSMEESLEMLKGLYDLGFRKVVTTPHIMSDFYRNTPETILGGLEKVKEAAANEGIGLVIEAAAEYYLDEGFISMISARKPLLKIADRFVLFEVSYINPPDSIFDTAFELKLQGYVPVLAHPERYPYWYGKWETYERLREQGILFQLNSNSLCGYYGPPAKKCAEEMIDRGMIDFMGSDTHGVRHLEALKRTVKERYYWQLANKGLLNHTV
jgi:tyrosine-protein phosphatase YwqE